MSDKEILDLEIAKEKLMAAKVNLMETCVDLPGFHPETIVNNAQHQTVMNILIKNGLCTATTFLETMADNINNATMDLLAPADDDETEMETE